MRVWLLALVAWIGPFGCSGDTSCVIPSPECIAGCGDLVRFTPPVGTGYENIEPDDESDAETSASYLRRDLMLRVQYAAAVVGCSTSSMPIALGDMSERDGATPGTREGRPRHHAHTRGRDIDIAYFQRDEPDNHMRAICNHFSKAVDQHHCVDPPDHLDVLRTARFLGAIFEDRHIRAVGVDGKAGPLLDAELGKLCAAKAIPQPACDRAHLSYETRDAGQGWYLFHYAHLHVSWTE